jgi:hypothetical protein
MYNVWNKMKPLKWLYYRTSGLLSKKINEYENNSLVLKQIYDYMIANTCKAIAQGEKVLPVYCFDDLQTCNNSMVLKTGNYRAIFVGVVYKI